MHIGHLSKCYVRGRIWIWAVDSLRPLRSIHSLFNLYYSFASLPPSTTMMLYLLSRRHRTDPLLNSKFFQSPPLCLLCFCLLLAFFLYQVSHVFHICFRVGTLEELQKYFYLVTITLCILKSSSALRDAMSNPLNWTILCVWDKGTSFLG